MDLGVVSEEYKDDRCSDFRSGLFSASLFGTEPYSTFHQG